MTEKMSRPDEESDETAQTAHGEGANENDTPTGYGSAYGFYRERGWRGVLPLPPGAKYPPPSGYTGRRGADPDDDQLAIWAGGQTYRDGGLCLRLPDGVIGIDVDAYGSKTGAATLAEAEKRWGPLPPTLMTTSRDDGVSGIRLFRVPPGTVLAGVISFPELNLGDVEIVQYHHRYANCWPTMHPEGRRYRWIDQRKTGEQK